MNTTTMSPDALITAEGRGSLVRPRFTPGLLLLDEDLTAGVDYTRELSRLLFRNLFGCGVICGLTVTGKEATGRCLTVDVNCGLALDCVGDPVQVRQPQSLTIMAAIRHCPAPCGSRFAGASTIVCRANSPARRKPGGRLRSRRAPSTAMK
jgi:hypothetical protein